VEEGKELDQEANVALEASVIYHIKHITTELWRGGKYGILLSCIGLMREEILAAFDCSDACFVAFHSTGR
jgi:hypothetical protein